MLSVFFSQEQDGSWKRCLASLIVVKNGVNNFKKRRPEIN